MFPAVVRCVVRTLIGIGGLLLGPLGLIASGSDSPIDFGQQIRPLLSNSCFACHGPDRGQAETDLRLDNEELATEWAIVPGDADNSPLIERVSSDDPDLRMPPPSSKKEQLTAEQIELLRRWVDSGAGYIQHWAYQIPRRPSVPEVADVDWPRNPIDRFVMAQNQTRSVAQAVDADPRTLVRRLSFDLLGLPPSLAEVQQFQSDSSSSAYDRLVDRMLESKHFGERMAVFWLDLVRFADTCGYHGDQHREIDAYRDYIIEAFNSDKSFDQFTEEQIAGDLLPQASREQRIASGYNRLLQTTEEGGAQPQEYVAIYAADRVRNAASVWLGSTLGCAQCHDHKFDPFTTRDFYSFAAFFADVQEAAVGRQEPNLELATAAQRRRMQQLSQQIDQAKQDLADPVASSPDGKPADSSGKEELAALERERKELQTSIRRTLVTAAGTPRVTRVLARGNWQDQSGEIVEPAIPAFFGSVSTPGVRATRLDLARWILSPDNPLTDRVFVNHLWRLLFGQGLVRTPDDFGAQGEYPTHPELLDWLAIEFRASGRNVKSMMRLIVTSRTYQQSSQADSELRRSDPYNRWLARQGRFRLDAELVRDNALRVSGLLVDELGGHSVKPYQPAKYWAQLNFPQREYEPDQGDNQHRRGVYTYWCRTFLHPSLLAFDAPTREECTAQRPRSNTPLQALVLLNDPTYVEAARALAEHVLQDTPASGPDGVRWVFREVLAREPSDLELQEICRLYDDQLRQYQREPQRAEEFVRVGQRPVDERLNVVELAAWTAVSRVLLNLHETITRD